ncbi:hypothetical protein [Couchioplanes caeruleus]|uniref:hypothetical protein n=1 Tax=Couchioplanes caeruleus TaxID=56438 RepID=UPI001160755B|nr:hypothetical protein [Couchioplanes caeruleus]
MTLAPPVAQAPPAPAWDPGPRPPRWIAALVALLLVIAGTAFGLYGVVGFVRAPFGVRADVCPMLDLGPLTDALTVPDVQDMPGAPQRYGGLSRAACASSIDGRDVSPRAIGELRVEWFDSALAAEMHFALAEGNASGRSQVADLGERAFAAFDPDEAEVAGKRLRRFSVAVLDSNVFLGLRVTVSDRHADMPWPDGQVDAAHAVLTETARTALQRLA